MKTKVELVEGKLDFGPVVVNAVVAVASRLMDVKPDAVIKSRSRKEPVANARALSQFLLREHSTIKKRSHGRDIRVEPPYATLGRIFGRDHGSVMNGCRKIGDFLYIDPRWRDRYQEAKRQLGLITDH